MSDFTSRTVDGPGQFCRGALERGEYAHRCTTYTTLHLFNDTRRFHFCDEHPLQQLPVSERGPFTVTCSAAPNPDFGQTRDTFKVATRFVIVDTLSDASRACRNYIERHDLGGGNWTGGEVKDREGTIVARVSYNGRIWTPEPYPKCTEIKPED